MVICPKCSIEHEIGSELCEKCGSFLMTEQGGLSMPETKSPVGEERRNEKLLCPRCRVFYKLGNYCPRCGVLLMEGAAYRETEAHPPERKLIKRISKEWRAASREKKKAEGCLGKLETQRDNVSADVFDPLFARYHARLKSFSSRHQEIETELESIRKRALGKIDLLEKELIPIQRRLDEVQSLFKLGAMEKNDFSGQKKEIEKEIKSREKYLKQHRQIISLLAAEEQKDSLPAGTGKSLRSPFAVMIAGGIMILMAAGAYFLWPKFTQSNRPAGSEGNAFRVSSTVEDREGGKINLLFETIKKANLQKNIDLFMSCYALDFKERDERKASTQETWKKFDYLDLTYGVKEQTVSGDTALVRVEWLIRLSPKAGGKTQDSRAVLDVALKKEEGHWRIEEVRSVR